MPKSPEEAIAFATKHLKHGKLAKFCRMLEEARASIVLAGGCELTDETLGRMCVYDLLGQFAANDIEIRIRPILPVDDV